MEEKSFKKSFKKEERLKKSLKLLEENSNQIPVIFEKEPLCKLEGLIKTKYLINKNYTLADFISAIKKKLKMDETDALFLIAKYKKTQKALIGSITFKEIYDKYKDDDGFLYITYSNVVIWG